MATSTIPKNLKRKPQEVAILDQQQVHDKLQNILDSGDKELINALDVTLGALENTLPGKEAGAA